MKYSEEDIKIETIEDWYQYSSQISTNKEMDLEDVIQLHIKVASKAKHVDRSLEGKSLKDQDLLSHYLDNIFLYSDKYRYLEIIDYCQKCENIANDFLFPIAIKVFLLTVIFKHNSANVKKIKLEKKEDELIITQLEITKEHEINIEIDLRLLLIFNLKKIKIDEYKKDCVLHNTGKGLILDFIKMNEQGNEQAFSQIFRDDINSYPLSDGKNNNEYYSWCKKKRLLLSIYNLLSYVDIYNDDLVPPIITTNAEFISDGEWFYSLWKQMCQEYTSARYIFYQYHSKTNYERRKHVSDKNNEITKPNYYELDFYIKEFGTLPTGKYSNINIIYSFEIEELKSAYIRLYNIFDKIAVLIFSYIKSLIVNSEYIDSIQKELERLEKKGTQISFNTFSKINKRKELVELIKENNLFLYCLFSINADLCSRENFKRLKTIRNKITHGYIKVVSLPDDENYQEYEKNKIIHQNYLNIEINNFENNFELLLYTVKNSLFYCKLCIDKIQEDLG